MTDTTPDIEAIRKRAEVAAKALDVGGISGAFLCVEPILNDIPALLSHIAALEAEHKAEMLDLTRYAGDGNNWRSGNTVFEPHQVLAAYLAQKEKK